MVLSDRFAGQQKSSLLKRTMIYVLSFGLGALLIVGLMSFTFVSIADALLPGSGDKPIPSKKASKKSSKSGDSADDKAPSKAARRRGKAGDDEEL